jgi:predicted ATP-grasp superfamily ATP-dependent carboligase
MKKTPKKILITFARSFLALEIARHFYSTGHEVFVADSLSQHVSRYSNAVKKSFKLPSPRFNSKAYINELIHIIQKEKIDFLIPVYEEISYISKAIEKFPNTCKILAPSFNLYNELQNKWLFQEKLKSLGFETLKAQLIQQSDDIQNLNFNIPFAIKPCYSRASQKVQKIMPGQCAIVKIKVDPYNPWIAQEWAIGKKFCTYSICHGGKIFAHGVYPVNYAIDGYSCLTFQAVEHPEIFEWISEFVKKIDYTGQIAFDLIETNDKKLFAIECNPRATSGLLLFNDKKHLDASFLGISSTLVTPRIGLRRQVAMGMLLYGWRKQARPNNRLRSFLKDFFGTKDVIFKTKDPKPFLFKPLIFANLWIKSRKVGLKLPHYFTHDHDWNGESLDHLKMNI